MGGRIMFPRAKFLNKSYHQLRYATTRVHLFKRADTLKVSIQNVFSTSSSKNSPLRSMTEKDSTTPPLTKDTAHSLVLKLTEEERTILLTSLQEFEAEQKRKEYRGQLANFRWRSKFGRPSKVPRLGDVDPTGSYCPVPEDWLLRKYAETVPKPTTAQLLGVAVHNAIPFVGFGFLDNFVMIVCGDYIDYTLGSIVVMSTMAAAALGNTFSDVLGIGSAMYVERVAAQIGVKPPALSPIQLDMFCSRLASNLGRVFGVTLGCLLGMFPLLFIKAESHTDQKTKDSGPEET